MINCKRDCANSIICPDGNSSICIDCSDFTPNERYVKKQEAMIKQRQRKETLEDVRDVCLTIVKAGVILCMAATGYFAWLSMLKGIIEK